MPAEGLRLDGKSLQIITLSRRTIITDVVLHMIVPAPPFRAALQSQAANRG